MKILHVTSSLDPRAGGTTTALTALAHGQMDAGLNVSIAATFASDFRNEIAERLKSLGVQVTLVGPNRKFLAYHPGITAAIEPLVKSADVVHIHAVWEEIQHRAAKLARQYHKPYVFTPHGMLDPWSLSQGRLKKKLYLALRLRKDLAHAAALHFSDEIERDLAKSLNLSPPSIVERHIVDLSEFQSLPERGAFRRRFQAVGDRPIVLFLSRLHPKKGLDLLLPAFARSAGADAVLVLAGPVDETYKRHLTDQVRTLGIADRTIFTGMLYGSERVAAFVDAAVFVLPSYQENFGIVVIESLAAGTPVVISDQVNIHRQITESGVGSVVPMNVDELAVQLGRYLTTTLRAEAAGRARAFVFREYDRDVIARRWVERYRQLVGKE